MSDPVEMFGALVDFIQTIILLLIWWSIDEEASLFPRKRKIRRVGPGVLKDVTEQEDS